MQRVIAGYDSLEQAEMAVRSLEPHLSSIQDVVIADKNHRTWRKLHPDVGRAMPFLVVMTGKPELVARARELLRKPHTATPAHTDMRGAIPNQTAATERDVSVAPGADHPGGHKGA
jgi:hypothetical protein